jgi:hypothetical protein
MKFCCPELARNLGISAPRLYRWQKHEEFGQEVFQVKVIYNEYQKRPDA